MITLKHFNGKLIYEKKYNLDKKPRAIQLNELGTSYILIDYLPQKLEELGLKTFNDMWNLHPSEKHKIIHYKKEIEVYRYSQSYLNTPTNLDHVEYSSYMYSGYDTSKNNIELPNLFKPFYDHMTQLDNKYNQVIANWYDDNNDFIAKHSDCTRNIIENPKISILSLNPSISNNNRYLHIRPKKKNLQSLEDNILIELTHGSIITMCGDTQKEFVHSINKQTDFCPKRISLSFRQMIS